jgi:hypothetical protein
VSPGLSETALRATGYDAAWQYFMGLRQGNSTHIGWSGNANEGNNISPKGNVNHLNQKEET